MNKGELIDAITKKANLTKKDVELIVGATFDVIVDAVAEGNKVTLVGFGSFEPRARAAREGRNPKTREKMLIPATVVPVFSAGKQFKEAVAKPE
ncbi:MAG: HU family DNA-binding protein [Anaerolineae bacterium]|nr:HU family DNA-binding protein [Gloeobacterales cyanobacterium ES-bin-313]